MNGEDRLENALRALAGAAAGAEASPRVRAALLKQVRRRRMWRAIRWWPAAAAALVAGIGIGSWTRTGRSPAPDAAASLPGIQQPASSRVPPAAREATPAVPAPAEAPLRRAAASRQAGAARLVATPWMVHQALPPAPRGQVLRLPVSAELAQQFGVPQPSGTWQAEIFIGDDGLARAFRLVRLPAYE